MNPLMTPRTMHLEITNFCNLKCQYCNHFTSDGDVEKDLPTDQWLQFFDELGDCGIMTVYLSGGEPLCRKDIARLIEGIVKNRMRFHLLSNAALITSDIACGLKATNRCNSVQVSIDGSSPRTHDSCRGAGAFDDAMNGIEALRIHNVPVDVRVTLGQHNVHDIENVAVLLLEELKLPSFSVNSVFYMGMCTADSDRLQLTIPQQTQAMEDLVRLNNKYSGRIAAAAGPLAQAYGWARMEAAAQKKSPPFSNGGCLTGCGCVKHEMAVRADGVMVPCNLLSHIELGRINQDSLREVWQNHPQMKRLRDRSSIPLKQFKFCQGCSYTNYCTGNCPATAYTITGNHEHPAPDECYRKFLKDGGKLPGLLSPKVQAS